MTMSTISEELARHQERYIRSWELVDQIVNFAMTGEAKDLPDLPGVPRETVELLLKPEGRKELLRWLKAFQRSVDLMRKFNIQRDLGVPFNLSDWRIMDESAAKTLEIFKNNLQNLAAVRNR